MTMLLHCQALRISDEKVEWGEQALCETQCNFFQGSQKTATLIHPG